MHYLRRISSTKPRACILAALALPLVVLCLSAAGPAEAANAGLGLGGEGLAPAPAFTAAAVTPLVLPAITAVSPNSGPAGGGTSVKITGSEFTGATEVKFGTVNAASFKVESATEIKAVSPASSGVASLSVTTPGGTSTTGTGDEFTYIPAPTVTKIEPSTGPAHGGTIVTITGTNLTGVSAVKFGTNAATRFEFKSATEVKATSPGGTGKVAVIVTTPGGTSASTASDEFIYVPAPTVEKVTPDEGPIDGGTSVTISGTNLTGASVKFGSTAAVPVEVKSTQIKVNSPAGSAGTANVTVTTIGGVSKETAADDFTYDPIPTITKVEPHEGPTSGGTEVTITGTGFTTGTTLKSDTVNWTGVKFESATEIKVVSPAGSGTAILSATTPGGTSSTGAGDEFTYVPVPTVTKIAPSEGPTGGGTTVTITGANFTGAKTVKFGAAAATKVEAKGPGEVKATSPAGSGKVNVAVTTTGGTSAAAKASEFTYVPAPAVTKVEPGEGPVGGGTEVTITGIDLSGASAVKFGTIAATGLKVESATEIKAVSPPGSGTVKVTVTTTGGVSPAADGFTYVPAPAVAGVSPGSGSTSGGSTVTISGSNLSAATAVDFGSNAAASFRVLSAEAIEAVSPPGSGTVDVTVTTVGGTSAAVAGDHFSYLAPPVPTAGGGVLASASLPAPVLGHSANIAVVTGRVSIRLPGSRSFVAITGKLHIPYHAVLETVHGEIKLTAATAIGGTQTAELFDGRFLLTQGASGRVLVTLSGGNFTICSRAAKANGALVAQPHAAAPTHLVRRLWAHTSGNFEIRGNYAEGVVEGTQWWLTEDMCNSTLVLATRGRVEVTDLVRHRAIAVLAGNTYIAKKR